MKNYVVDFGPENGEKIYYEEGLSPLDNKDLLNALGHNIKKSKEAGSHIQRIRKGRFKPFEVKEMCISFKKDPRKIRSKYSSNIFKLTYTGKGSILEKLDEKTEEAVWNAICDKNDNKRSNRAIG